MTRIKICGITNKEDALAAVGYGADALGFIFVPESPRYTTEEQRDEVLWSVPPLVSRVAVCIDPQDIDRRYEGMFDTIQFYKGEPDQSWHWYGHHHLAYAARIRNEESLPEIAQALDGLKSVDGTSFIDALLLDTYHKDKLGGSGETFNWELAVEAKRRFPLPLILAGGLTPDNVAEAVRSVRPYAVDVSSGVELAGQPGRKDHEKIRRFIEAVRDADSRL